MESAQSWIAPRPILLCLVAFVFVLAACGDDGDSGGKASDATAAEDAAGGAEEKRVADAMRELRELYNDTDGEGFCAGLTGSGRQEVVRLQRQIKSDETTCAGIVTDFSKGVVESGSQQRVVEVRQVKVNGDKARIVIKGGLAGYRTVVPFRFVKVGGDWKLDDPISAAQRRIRVEADGPPLE